MVSICLRRRLLLWVVVGEVVCGRGDGIDECDLFVRFLHGTLGMDGWDVRSGLKGGM